MNLEELPDEVKNDIEDQSLAILEETREDIVVIGGWAVRAHLGTKHGRHTLDIDGVAEDWKLPEIGSRLRQLGFRSKRTDWGTQFYQEYRPRVEIRDRIRSLVQDIQLRMEISGPRIAELRTHHYFEFSLSEYERKELQYHSMPKSVQVKVPPAAHLAAAKLGLPADYKNSYDAAALLHVCDIDEVIETIRRNDDWAGIVADRLPKLIGRIGDQRRLEHILAVNAGIDVKEHVKKLSHIGQRLT